MTNARLLLPFTEKIDMVALIYAVRYAKRHRATLVPLALIPLSKLQWERGPRLEAIEQANDFMEVVKYQAARVNVKLDPCTLWTRDVMRSIRLFSREMVCGGILLFMRDGAPVLLSDEIIKELLDEVPSTLLLVQLRPKRTLGMAGALPTMHL